MKSLLILQCLLGLRVASGLQDEEIIMFDDDSSEEFMDALSDSSTQQTSLQTDHVNGENINHGVTVQEDSGKTEATTVHVSDKSGSRDAHVAKNGPHEKKLILILGEEIFLPVDEHNKDEHAEPENVLEEYVEAIEELYTNPKGGESGSSNFTDVPDSNSDGHKVTKHSSTLPAKHSKDSKAETVKKNNSTSEKSKLSSNASMITEKDKVPQHVTGSSINSSTHAHARNLSSKKDEMVKEDQSDALAVVPLDSGDDDDVEDAEHGGENQSNDSDDDSFAEDYALFEAGSGFMSSPDAINEDNNDSYDWKWESLSSEEDPFNLGD